MFGGFDAKPIPETKKRKAEVETAQLEKLVTVTNGKRQHKENSDESESDDSMQGK